MACEWDTTIGPRAAWCFQRLLLDLPVSDEVLDSLIPAWRDLLRAFRDCCAPAERGDEARGWTDVWMWHAAAARIDPEGPLPVQPRQIEITPVEDIVVEAVAQALAADPEIYYQGPRLVRIAGEAGESPGMFSEPGGLRVEGLPAAAIRTTITRVARLTRDVNHATKLIHPPEWLANAIRGRGRWDTTPGARRLSGVVESPTLRPDGSILEAPGYDRASGLIYLPSGSHPPVPETPTREEAQAAARRLLALTDEFPYVSPADHSVWLALVLTLAGRYAIDGPTPLVWFDASDRGCGKTTLAELAALIATGRIPPARSLPATPQEWPKTILAIARSAARLVLFDNADNGATIGGAALDAALTATRIAGRPLGTMEDTAPIPLACTWALTGNNLSLGGDLIRRVIRCRLVSREERPELRGGYRIADILGHTRTLGNEYLRDALIVLRGHAAAGRPGHGLSRLGRFEAWDDVVRAAITWAGIADPVATIQVVREEDEKTARETALVHGWAELPEASRRGYTVAEVMACLRDYPSSYPGLRGAIAHYEGRTDRETPRRVGEAIRAIREKNRGGFRLVRGKTFNGAQRWRAESLFVTVQGGEGGEGGPSPCRSDLSTCPCADNQVAPNHQRAGQGGQGGGGGHFAQQSDSETDHWFAESECVPDLR